MNRTGQIVMFSLAAGLLLLLLLMRQPAESGGPATAPLQEKWARNSTSAIDLAVGPGGTAVLALGLDGVLRAYGSGGSLAWNAPASAADRVVLSPGGGLALLYARENGSHTLLKGLDRAGGVAFRFDTGAPVRTVAVSPDESVVAAAAGKEIIILSREEDEWDARRVHLPEPASAIACFDSAGLIVLLGGGQVLTRMDALGRVIWSRRLSSAATSLSVSSNGRSALSLRQPGRIRLEIRSPAGQLLYTGDRPGQSGSVHLSAGGSAVYMPYDLSGSQPGEDSLVQPRLAFYLLTPDGRRLRSSWVKGGAFTRPVPVAVTAEGDYMVTLDAQPRRRRAHFRLFDSAGNRQWLHRCPAYTELARASPDGRWIGLYRTDGRLELLEVVPVSTPPQSGDGDADGAGAPGP